MKSRAHPSCLHSPEIVIYFQCRIESSYPNERRLFVTHFCNELIARIDDYALNTNNESDTVSITTDKEEKHRFYTDDDLYNAMKSTPFDDLLYLFAPYIIHDRFMSPFNDTRDAFSKLLHHINDKLHLNIAISSPPYPLSGFLDLSFAISPYESSPTDDDLQFEQIYTNFGRISHFELLISQHKDYLRDFNDLFTTLMNSNAGPLGQEQRQYLGLMAASRYSCKPIITQCELKYRMLNGDMTWIKSGIKSAPSKYAKLAKINALLAHQPWLLTATHIAELVHGNGAWTISECVQSFVILIVYHFLCGMYQGLCITPDIDLYYTSILHNVQSQSESVSSDLKDIFNNILRIDEKSEDLNVNNLNITEDEEDEDARSQNIAKLLSHTQQQLLRDEDIVGGKRTGFEQAACLNREMDSVSEASLFPDHASRSCFIKFRQLSDSGNDEEHDSLLDDSRSISMEYDPNMAPSSLSANELQSVIANKRITDESEEKEEHKKPKEEIKIDCAKLTSSDWKQIITLRKENMFALSSVGDDSNYNGANNSNMMNNNNNNLWETEEQKLAKITNPSKYAKLAKNKKKRKYAKIAAPASQGTVYWKYSLGIDMTYNDFDCHKNYQIHAYDFNWDKHGYALLSRYYPGIEKRMDAVFKTAYTMTDHCINGADNLDTEPFRIAVWHYTFRLYGVHNDSYEYRFVNIYLPVKLKIFIKKLVCYPQIVTIDDVKKMGVALKEKEKIHVAILALEAKKQAALLFGLRAIMKYMQQSN